MPINISLIKGSLRLFETRRDNVRRRFYEILCSESPQLDAELSDDDKRVLRAVFDEGLAVILRQFHTPDRLEASLLKLGAKYRGEWMRPEYTSFFRDAFMSALEEELGAAWSQPTYDAWDEALGMGLLIIQRARETTSAPSEA
ncbi:MAG: hypothetical protein OEV49_17610 [candidate division Zixibacteria bacterium]|nr:hypothetical protein [candidate division Zixibacteria bacterium]MDH3938931.1 hypothetical protein [candidate division Zixibacteria bacterium]MDH4035298.1 hypothetical protein [candidate division Zixibacteria bacterium]